MDKEKYTITLELPENEFLAIARIGHRELRSPRNQAHYLLRNILIESGALVHNPASIQTLQGVTE